MSNYDKYLKGGSLNPRWVDEQNRQKTVEDTMDNLHELLECFEINEININLAEGIDLSLSPGNNSSSVSIDDNDYEAKFKFIKDHSDNPEDLKLAREIIGLD